jgi:hypothetical protein
MKGNALDRLMAPVADCLDEASLRALVDLRADTAQSDRIQELAERCNEGQLSDGERAEYETMILFGNFLGVLQSNARRKLKALG